jgi:putative transcriptional regulator
MESQYPTSLKAQFLIAMPGLTDPNFNRTLTCLCEHTPEGALGIVVNRVHPSARAGDIFDQLKIDAIPEAVELPIHIGGPVHFDEIFILHGPPFGWKGCFQITRELALSNTKDILEAVSKGRGPEKLIIAIGAAGWGPGQLESEIVQNAWLTGPVFNDVIFDVPIDDRWDQAVKKMGIDPNFLTDASGHA